MSNLYYTAQEHKKILDSYLKSAKRKPDETINKAYDFVKRVANIYYKNSEMDPNYNFLISALHRLESKCLGRKNLLEFSKKMNTNDYPRKQDDFFNYLVWHVRRYLMGDGAEDVEDLFNWKFQYRCTDAASLVNLICKYDFKNLKSERATIYIGYDRSKYIDFDIDLHCFNIVEYESKRYLVDITYAQFFDKSMNHIGRMGIPKLEGPSVGYYMLLTDRSRDIAYKILTDGYIELDDEILKIYLGAFTLSFRNGLFYEDGNNNFCVPYSIKDYKKFLKGTDSQVKHEKIKCLGRQQRPLNNPSMDFKNIKHG